MGFEDEFTLDQLSREQLVAMSNTCNFQLLVLMHFFVIN